MKKDLKDKTTDKLTENLTDEINEEIVIVGGGAAGLFAAILIARAGKSVLVIEALEKPGKKILQTGNGRCNLTNLYFDKKMYNTNNETLVDNVFNVFKPTDTIEKFEKMGLFIRDIIDIEINEKNARYTGIYPSSNQATSVVDTLISYCYLNKVRFMNNTVVEKITSENDGFNIVVSNEKEGKAHINAKKVLITVGTKAGVKTDYSNKIIQSVLEMGHSINQYLPALCSLYADKKQLDFFKKVAGVRSDVKASLFVNNVIKKTAVGELQLSDYGLSGIVTFQLSALASKAIYKYEEVIIKIDFIPEYDSEAIAEKLMKQLSYEKMSLLDLISKIINNKLAKELVNEFSKNNNDIKAFTKNLTKKQLISVIEFMKKYEVKVVKTNDYLHSQICTGGINCLEINEETLESKKIKNLYFAGEVVDVDGLCGGYNLQWAWSSAVVAGRNIIND